MLDLSFSWRGKPRPTPTDEEVVESSIALAEQAAFEFARAQAAYDRLPPGDPQLVKFACDMARHRSDQAHWREVARWLRERIAAGGGK